MGRQSIVDYRFGDEAQSTRIEFLINKDLPDFPDGTASAGPPRAGTSDSQPVFRQRLQP
jgi:hypothetical protein